MHWFWQLSILCALASPAYAQDVLDNLPECALNCSLQFIERMSCSATEKACLCADPQGLMTGIVACAGASCRVRDVLFVTNSTLLYCDVPRRDESWVLELITGLFGGLALLVVLLRMLTRIPPFKAKFGWDDGLIVAVMVVGVGGTIINFSNTKHGFGRDIFTIPPDDIETILKAFYAGELTYDFTITVTKLSILCFYLRIFIEPSFKRSAYILMGFCLAYLFSIIPATIWQCTPISYMWTAWSGETKGHCIDVFLLTWIATSANIALDLAIILLPVPQLLKLTLSKKKKVQIIAMFCVGLFVTITSVVRLQSVIQFKATQNFSWDYLSISYMSTLESNVGIICACMPAMQLLLRRAAPRLFGSTTPADSYLHPNTASRTKTNRDTNSHNIQAKKGITKTITTTVTDMKDKDSDSTIELVDR